MTSDTELKTNSIDIFLSYDSKIESSVTGFYEALTNAFDLNVYMESTKLTINHKYYTKPGKAIVKSTMMVCCMNKDYLNSRKCKNELILAYMTAKPILVLFFQKMHEEDYDAVLFAIEKATKHQLIDLDWNETILSPIVGFLQTMLKRKLQRRAGKYNSEIDLKNRFNESDDESSAKEKLEVNEKALATPSKSTIEILPKKSPRKVEEPIIESLCVSTYVKEELDKTIIRDERYNDFLKFKTTPLLEFGVGYNRIVYLQSRQRFLITSSYNKTIMTIDRAGNWLEKRNPGSLLKQPWAICLNQNNDIFVGDNGHKCVFMFDQYFKHIKTFCENMLLGFFDMTIDYANNNHLYAVSLYESVLALIDIPTNKLKQKVSVSAPTFVRIIFKNIFVASADDVIIVINKDSLLVELKIEFTNGRFLTGLCVLNDRVLFTTVNKIFRCTQKSKSKYLAIIKLNNQEVSINYLDLHVEQINDIVMLKDHLLAISDTHVDISNYNDITEF